MIVAGFGFRAKATRDSLADALDRAAPGQRPQALATVAEKADATALVTLAADLDLPIQSVSAEALARQDTPSLSSASIDAHGTGSVAEAAALAAAGPSARLVAPRSISHDRLATCALAIGHAA